MVAILIGERERANLVVQLPRFFYISYVDLSVPVYKLYATPAGPRGIPERIRRKLYLYFKNTTSTFRIGGIYSHWSHGSQVARGIGLCCFHAPDVKISSDIRDKPGTFTYHNPGVAYGMNHDLSSLLDMHG